MGIDAEKHAWKEMRHTTASLMQGKGGLALAIKDQLRHSNIRTTVDFYTGSDIGYQREQVEKLIFDSWKLVGKEAEAKDIENAYA